MSSEYGRRAWGKEVRQGSRDIAELTPSVLFIPLLTRFRVRKLSSYDVGKGPGNYFWPSSLLMSLPQRNFQTCWKLANRVAGFGSILEKFHFQEN